MQGRLTRCYGIDDALAVDDFVRCADEDDGREELLIRHGPDGLELALQLPRAVMEPGVRPSLDQLCQVVEGVSHFLYVAERARRERQVTELEMELQAEVDKYVVLVDPCHNDFRPRWSAHVRERLYDRVHYAHAPGTERGDRYRMANELAARFAGRLEAQHVSGGRVDLGGLREALRRFYWAGQTEKIEIARAA